MGCRKQAWNRRSEIGSHIRSLQALTERCYTFWNSGDTQGDIS